MKIKFLMLVAAASVIAGCASSSPMGETQYKMFGSLAGATQRCFDAGYMTPQMYANTKGAMRTVLQSWDYDQSRLESVMRQEYSNAAASSDFCRKVEGYAYELISAASKHERNARESAAENQRAWSDAINSMNKNKPVFCNTVAGVTMCN